MGLAAPRESKRPRVPTGSGREVQLQSKKAKVQSKTAGAAVEMRSVRVDQAVAANAEHVVGVEGGGVVGLRRSRATIKRRKVGSGRATEGPGT